MKDGRYRLYPKVKESLVKVLPEYKTITQYVNEAVEEKLRREKNEKN